MYFIKNFTEKVNNLAPDPWIVDGVEQSRPMTQLGVIMGVILGLVISYFIFF